MLRNLKVAIIGCILATTATLANAALPPEELTVPEPGTLVLLGLGLAAIGLIRNRKR